MLRPWRHDVELCADIAQEALIRVYQYWIALSDCDGFRIDTVKHVPWEASRNFCGAIREFADAGYSHVYVHQVGPDQDGFFAFYEREVRPKVA